MKTFFLPFSSNLFKGLAGKVPREILGRSIGRLGDGGNKVVVALAVAANANRGDRVLRGVFRDVVCYPPARTHTTYVDDGGARELSPLLGEPGLR